MIGLSKMEMMLAHARLLGPGESMLIACATDEDAKRVADLIAKEMLRGVQAVGPGAPCTGSSQALLKIMDDVIRREGA